METVDIIGGGLAGCEAALQLAGRGIQVRLHEMRPGTGTAVHETGDLAELVCSNSLKSTNIDAAAGLLKYELQLLGSRLLGFAFECRVPAGGALAIDRHRFAVRVTRAIEEDPHITVVREEVHSLDAYVGRGIPFIIAAGPLCAPDLAADLSSRLGAANLSFFDAAAPVVEAASLDRSVLFAQSRHGRGGSDYLNAAFDRDVYEHFIDELLEARRVIVRDFEQRDLFSACQPVEEIARSGRDALRYGALKPIGLVDPSTGHRPWAVVQLRAENAECTAYNLVGFQTNLTFGEQDRVFRMIPGLAEAEFVRHGVMHRNTFVDAPQVLDASFRSKAVPDLFLAGQISGTEGYLEAVASGLLAALSVVAEMDARPSVILPRTTVLGALRDYATSSGTTDYQPMHVNFGILPPLDPPVRRKAERYHAYSQRAQEAMAAFVADNPHLGFLDYRGPDLREVSALDARDPEASIAPTGHRHG